MTRKIALSLAALTLTTLLAAAAQAGDHPNARRGWIVGFGLGSGSSMVEYDRPSGKYESDDDEIGGAFGVRVGYGLSDRFTLTLDTDGYQQKDDDWETSIGATVAMATYHFGGGGFFLRAGLGAGRLETKVPADLTGSPAVAFEKTGPVAALGFGYEWRVGEKFALGLALDSRGGGIADFGDLEEISFGKSTLGMQFNWYL
jgi:hypothetical protein